MEYLVKIVSEQRSKNKGFWEYNFLDIQTDKEDYFYNNYRINYIPNQEYKLNLSESDKDFKLFQSLEENIANTIDKNQKEKVLIQLERLVIQRTKKRRKLKLIPQEIRDLKKEGLSQKRIAKFCRVNERTIRR